MLPGRLLPIFMALLLGAMAVPARAATIQITMQDLVFAPAEVSVRVGDTIEWINEDFLDHTVTAEDESFDLALPAGQSARLEMKRSGAVRYFCRTHPNMRGTVNVD